MQRATIIVGTAAAVLALGLGLFGTGFGAAMAAPGFQTAVILTPIVLAVGTGLSLLAPGFAALVLLFGTFGLLYSFGFNFVTALPVLLSVAAGVMSGGTALRRGAPDQQPESEDVPRERVQLSGGNRREYPP
ncbi:MAG: hypothetical protein IT534_02275 [Bauldia sp.]|nr:hypothetical protein [Bauldia sp.]